MTLNQFKRKYLGHSVTCYKSIHAMYNDVLCNIALHKTYGNMDIVKSYEGILKDLNKVKTKGVA